MLRRPPRSTRPSHLFPYTTLFGSQLAGAPAKPLGLDIRLIEREPAHVWKPMLHTIAAGTADTGANQTAYLVQAQQRGFRFEMGEVMAVDRAAKHVLLAPLVVDGAEILPARSLP